MNHDPPKPRGGAPWETWTLPTTHVGRQVRVYDSLDSTNTLALSLASDSVNHGLVILARNQTAGRGQYGRHWQAPPESSVLLSVLIFPPPYLSRPVVLTALAAVSVCEVVKELTGVAPRIKWPNDVLVEGEKVCGILIEQRTTPSGQAAVVVGIGLNVTQSKEWFVNAGLPQATSLDCLKPGQSHAAVGQKLVIRLDDEYVHLCSGHFEDLQTRWCEFLALQNLEIAVELHDGVVISGSLRELNFDGVLLDVEGEQQRFAPEKIKHVTPS